MDIEGEAWSNFFEQADTLDDDDDDSEGIRDASEADDESAVGCSEATISEAIEEGGHKTGTSLENTEDESFADKVASADDDDAAVKADTIGLDRLVVGVTAVRD